MLRASFAAITATIAGSTTFADATWPPENVLLWGRPHIRAYSADLSAQRLTLDLATATALDVIWLCNVNFTTCTIQGNATDAAWGAPSYTSGALTIGRSGNTRYHHALRPVAFNYRYLSIAIPNQATTDGATVFKVGWVWPGLIVSPPRDILMEPDEDKMEAREDTKTQDGRLLERLTLDEPTWHFTAKRMAETEAELAAWKEIDRRWSEAPGQAALVLMRDAYPEESYVMRQVSASKWKHAKVWSESDMECVEV
jgi:hypothetical protein